MKFEVRSSTAASRLVARLCGAVALAGVSLHVLGVPPDALDIRAFSAVADDGKDDAPALQAAVDSLLDSELRSGVIYFPDGTFHFARTIEVPTELRSLQVVGNGWTEQGGWGGTWLVNVTDGDPLLVPVLPGPGAPDNSPESIANWSFERLAYTQRSLSSGGIVGHTCAGGDFLEVRGAVRSVNFLRLHDINFSLCNPNSSLLQITDTMVAQLSLSRLKGTMGTESAAPRSPAIDIRSKFGFNISGFTLRDSTINSQADAEAPIVRLVDASDDETGVGGQASTNIKFENFAMQVPGGGGIELRSVHSVMLENVTDADLVGMPAQPIVVVGVTEGSSIRPANITLINSMLVTGDPDSTSLFVENAGSMPGPTIISSTVRKIDSRNSPPLLIGASVSTPRLVEGTRLVRLRENGRLSGIAGISGNGEQARNLRGTIVVRGGSRFATHEFAQPETDDDYRLVLTPSRLRGEVSAGATRVRRVLKHADGHAFTIEVEQPPAVATGTAANHVAVQFDWVLVR